ncbi:MAG: C4-dicarboxylate transporter DcuC [Bacteroidales bacterium]
MLLISGIIAIHLAVLTGYLLWKNSPPAITLLGMGIIMFTLAYVFNVNEYQLSCGGNFLKAFYDYIYEAFTNRFLEAGLLIMLFGGYIEYMKKIKASDAIIYLMMRPVSVFKKNAYLFSIIVIPIGTIIYMTLPSATAMGLFFMATIYPVLLGLGVSRGFALSVISACTIFDVGIASWNSNIAAEALQLDISQYFSIQLPIMIPLILVSMLFIYLSNKYFDKKESQSQTIKPYMVKIEEWGKVPHLFYALFPLLPILILFISPYQMRITSSLSISIIISFFIVGVVDSIVKKSFVQALKSMDCFWEGFGKICMSVVVLMICADVFSQGLIRMGFIDFIIYILTILPVSDFILMFTLGIVVFFSVLLVGSGVSLFSSILPLMPELAETFGVSTLALTVSMQLITGIARIVSPIAIIVLTVTKLAGVSPMILIKRNLVPMLVVSLSVIIIGYFFIN